MLVKPGTHRFAPSPTYRTVKEALQILRGYGTDAHVWIPGIGSINGLTAGNYLDSAGTTAASIDGLIGRMNDAAQTLGPELVTNGDFSAGTTGWTGSGAGGWLIAEGVATHTAGTAGELRGAPNTLADGKTYVIEFDLTLSAGSVVVQFGGPGGTSETITTAGHKKIHGVAAGVATVNGIRFITTAGALTVDNVTLREVIGIHATQATEANKPKLRKGTVTDGVSDGIGNSYAEFDGTDSLVTSAMAGFTTATVISSVHGTGHSTLANQDVSAGYTMNTNGLCAVIILKTAPSEADLATMEAYADLFA